MSSYGKKAKNSNMDILYLLLPIIGAFILLFLVCCFGKKVKEMLHIPKELVLGRNFPGLASSSSSSTSSSRSSLSGNEADDSDNGDITEEPTLVINVNMERQRVLSQHRRRYYAQVPTDEMMFCLQGEEVGMDCHNTQQTLPQQQPLVSNCRLPVFNNCQGVHRKMKNQHRRADSCPLLMDTTSYGRLTPPALTSYVNVIHAPYRLHPGYWARCQGGADMISGDLDSDSSDIPANYMVLQRPDRRRHRSNSESDLPSKKCCDFGEVSCSVDPRLSQFSHKLSSTEFQLHAPQDCSVTMHSDCDQRSLSHAQVG